MMMTKPKPDGEREASLPPPTILTSNDVETTDDREKELERRLAMLGTGETAETAEVEAPVAAADDNLISFDAAPPAAPPVVESKPEPVAPKPAVTKPNKSALLARIMAAQERAKQAQMKQAAPAAPPIQQQSTTVLPAPAQMKINAELEKEKMMKALSGVVDVAMEKDKIHNDDNDFKPPSIPPPQFSMAPPTTAPPAPAMTMAMAPPPVMMAPPAPTMMAPPIMAPPIMAPPAPATTTAPPPPSFDIFEQQLMKDEKPVPPPPPPAFGTIENDLLGFPGVQVQAPSAPPPEDTSIANLDGMTPMAPPPPTYPEEGMTMDDELFMHDENGNKLSPEERRKMMEEQRAIMEQIKRQAIENKASEAAVRANAFETRMAGNGPVPVPSSMTSTSNRTREVTDTSAAVDVNNIDPAEVEEQRRILEEIQRNAKKSQGGGSAAVGSASNHMVDIGQGKKVELHGQEKTKEAIKDGTAILVQCANCDNWMQVTGAATLMFCPICNVVSPVLTQNSVQSSEAAQMEEDRKLAERLQNEFNAAVSDYPANRSRTGTSAATASTNQEGSWWDSMLVSMGVSDAPEPSQNKHSAEINVSRPPGSSGPTSSQRALHSDDYDSDPRAARVAESRPLFSCVVDSVSHAASAAAAGVSQMTYGDEEEVHGIDTTSFLAVPKVGDDRGASGSYSAIPNDD